MLMKLNALTPFPFLIIGPLGNKNWLPSMKVKKLQNYQNKMGPKHISRSSMKTQELINLGIVPFWGKFRIH